jgi:hypothetical protein
VLVLVLGLVLVLVLSDLLQVTLVNSASAQ